MLYRNLQVACTMVLLPYIAVLNLPDHVVEKEIWDIHTYFNNLFNSKDAADPLATLRHFLTKVLHECIIHNDVFRYVFLQRLKTFLQLQVLDIDMFIEQLIVEQTQKDLSKMVNIESEVRSQEETDVFAHFEPSPMDWLEKQVLLFEQ